MGELTLTIPSLITDILLQEGEKNEYITSQTNDLSRRHGRHRRRDCKRDSEMAANHGLRLVQSKVSSNRQFKEYAIQL
jgi:hypothetical protein